MLSIFLSNEITRFPVCRSITHFARQLHRPDGMTKASTIKRSDVKICVVLYLFACLYFWISFGEVFCAVHLPNVWPRSRARDCPMARRPHPSWFSHSSPRHAVTDHRLQWKKWLSVVGMWGQNWCLYIYRKRSEYRSIQNIYIKCMRLNYFPKFHFP